MKDLVKKLDNVPGPKEAKYKEFITACTKTVILTTNFMDKNFPGNCFKSEILAYIMKISQTIHQSYSVMTEKEYLTGTDPKIIKKVTDKATELDACFENSRNLTGINPDDTTINFCR